MKQSSSRRKPNSVGVVRKQEVAKAGRQERQQTLVQISTGKRGEGGLSW